MLGDSAGRPTAQVLTVGDRVTPRTANVGGEQRHSLHVSDRFHLSKPSSTNDRGQECNLNDTCQTHADFTMYSEALRNMMR